MKLSQISFLILTVVLLLFISAVPSSADYTVPFSLPAVSNASSGVAASTINVPTVSNNYQWNGTTWDQARNGAAVSDITKPASVVEPDDFPVSGSVTSAATLFSQDTLGYESISVEVTANASGNTITFETSDDNTNWVSTSGLSVSALAGTNGVSSTTTSSIAIFQFPKKARYFRARVSTFIGGTTIVAGNLHKAAGTTLGSNQVLASGTSAIGKVGPGYTTAQTPITASSGNVANASAAATLAAASGKNTYITGFQITSDGATTGVCVNPTVVGVIGGTMTYTYCAPTGVLLAGAPLIVAFPQPVISSSTNTAIVVTLPALGLGSTNATVVAQGYQE